MSMRRALIAASAAGLALAAAGAMAQTPKPTEFKTWGADSGRTNWSPISQINAANVAGLKAAWVYDPGTTGRGWESTPLLIDGLLYASDADKGDIIALEPETGKEVWRNKAPNRIPRVRGLTY